MCGITGVFNIHQRPLKQVPVGAYSAMTHALIHRGPDEEGSFQHDFFWLGFKRLSIIDLSHGQQPNWNEDRTIVSICNGEIFNYQELRADLQQRGHIFKTNCDVEVLVHLYEEYGTQMFKHLNGQFSFALYDFRQERFILARDHVGICPLFYTEVDQHLVFASEIKSILQYPGVRRQVNLEGLDQIFCLPGLCSPTTMFKHIHALKPGHFLQIESGSVSVHEYWDLQFESQPVHHPEEYYVNELHERLTQAVKYRLHADVPVGLYISGGLDSSIIAGLSRNLDTTAEKQSFGVVFDQGRFDEREYQRIVASHNNIQHQEILFDVDKMAGQLKQMIYCAETPLKETYNTCSLSLSQHVRDHGMKVVLTGEGADEVFAGYVGYKLDKNRSVMGNDLTAVESMFESEIRERVWGDEGFQYERNLYPYQDVRRSLYSDQLNDQFEAFNCLHERLIDKSKIKGKTPLQKRAYVDFKLRLSDHLLADHGDRVAYANSIEARYPFLDINVIEFAKTIPDELKLNDFCEKYILRKTFAQYLPPAIQQREKFGFVAPGARYLLQQNIDWVNDLLSYETIRRQGFFNPDAIETLKQTYLSDDFNLHETFEVDLLMIVITFGLFMELFDMEPFS
ncbi:asparagine synthase (glutamine-hydrolysing) [Chitinophaga skermanii]|uniref:asparagine synthase (glutamine-hydrolyzing) n=1 Tax=Chitinophaga skermanii TaxID=331697 RepID=A0A327R3B0_9BACT|nr:asparagine synthase (glutamine-hydrolyzing) [Chitinophaga skermanii]RAJ11141.1 asparagine synthase (glutamine-hydrolysing) [Chitinophaga skermanii]